MELNKTRTGVEAKFFDLCNKVVPEQGYRLYDLEYIQGQSLLRIYIMNEQTKSAVIEDCVAVDRALTPFFEEEKWIPEEIVLEVSSPGIDRSLKNRTHFEESVGEQIKCVLKKDIPTAGNDGIEEKILKKKKYIGTLKNVGEEAISLSFKDYELSIPFNIIKKANIEPTI
jgi:ribosome maturation factor RimP